MDSLTSKGLQAAGLPQSAANAVDAGLSVVGSTGAGIAATAARAGGVGNILNYEVGMNTLSPSGWAKYGPITDPVKRGAQMLKDLGPRALFDPSGAFSRRYRWEVHLLQTAHWVLLAQQQTPRAAVGAIK